MEEEASTWPRYMAIARHASLGIMAICAMLVLRIFSRAKKKTAPHGVGAAKLPEAEGTAGLLTAGADAGEPLMLRKRIANALQSNPEQVRQLFSIWLEEKQE
jgi:hypothetical protein